MGVDGERLIASSGPRPLPALDDVNRGFWTGGASGELLIQRCRVDRRWVYPPSPACPACGGELSYEPTQGTGSIFSFTVNYQQFSPDAQPPYVIAIVTLDEQEDLRLPTNIVASDAEGLECGTTVEVRFEQHGEVFVPVFTPTDRTAAGDN